MPNWNKILTEVEASNQVNALDRMRKEYFEIIHRETGRNVISYYSGWLKQPTVHTMIDELDKNAFMSITHSLDKGMGLDIIIHTPGGDLAVMENLINYLHKIFTQLYTLMYQTKYLILYYQLQGKIKPTYLRNRSVLK